MANYNLTDQTISSSFQQLLQKDTDTGNLVDGLGNPIDSLTISGSTTSDFFIGDGSQLTNIPHTEIPQGTVSGSSQIDYPEISNIPSGIVSGSVVTSIIAGDNISIDQSTGDVTITADASAVLPAGVVSGSSQVTLEDTTFTDGIQFQVLRTDGAGNLSFDFADRTQIEVRASEAIAKGDPLYVVSFNLGQNRVEVGKADASNSSHMPAYGLAYESVSQNTNTQMVSIGTLDDIDTQVTYDFQVGDTVYVAAGGGLTNVKPTGTNLIQNVGVVGRRNQNNGEIVVSAIGRSNDVPNIQEGYVWVGNASAVATATSTGSLLANLFNTDNTFTGTQTFNNINVNGTGSFAYIESVSGSAKIIGDAFIILNNNTPAERYAGVAVYDSGSANTTASFQFDGQTNDWFYEYSNDGGVTTDHGVAMFGPEYSNKGVPTYPTTNTLLKGNGHHVEDSNISDNGTEITINSNVNMAVNTAIVGPLFESTGEVATPLLLVDTLEPNTGTEISITSGNVTLSGNGQVLQNPNGAIVASTIEGQAEMASPLLLVDTIEPNNAAFVNIATDLNVSGNLTASLQEGYVWVGNNTGTTTTVSTGSFGGGGGGPATVTNLTVTSNTASIDLSLGTKFYLDLPVGSTELTIDNRVDGESFSLLVSQSVAGTGSVTFGDDTIKFAGGIPYQATNRTSAEDVISFEIFNRDNGAGSKYVYVSSVKNLI